MFNNKEMLNKKMEFIVAGAIGLYIVFFTRPAHPMIAQLLSSTVAQIAALAAVIYVGATQSLIVAVVLAVAVVLSSPTREHLVGAPGSDGAKNSVTQAKEKSKRAKFATESSVAEEGKAATMPALPGASSSTPTPANDDKKKPSSMVDALENKMNMGSKDVAAAGQDIPAVKPESKGSESFSLMNAAPF